MPHSTSRRRRVTAVVILVAALAAFPLGTAAIHQFTDVPDANIYHADIDALVDSGVTSGCGGGKYCPAAYVTREQMAAFLNRLGALAPEKTPVVNATTVDRYEANALNRVSWNSIESLVDGNVASSGQTWTPITAPNHGYLMVWGKAQIGNASGSVNDVVYCDLRVDGTTILHTGSWQDAPFGYAGDEQLCNTSGVKEVCAGSYEVALYVSDVDTDTDITYASVTVEFVPFGSHGQIPPAFICPT